jgi:hypothetical protein
LKDPISKITRAKWSRGVTQTVEFLLSKLKTLSSNPSLTNTKEPYKDEEIESKVLKNKVFFQE